MKKYKELYEEEKQRHEEALQRYKEDHTDEMEIIKLHKKCDKKDRKVLQPKALSKSDEPKKTIDDPSEEEQNPKKALSDVKKTTTKAGKKVKKTSQPKKAPKSLEFVDTDSDDTGNDKELPLLGTKEEAQSFFDLHKKSKNLTIEKKVEKVVFKAEPYKGYGLSYVALYNTKYLKRMLKNEKKTKNLIKQALAKT